MVRRQACFTIGVVAEMYDVHPQTLRMYEREGLLKPSRTEGNTRLYTEADLERLDTIVSLTRELGVNLAGVEVILNMREKMEAMQTEVEQLVQFLQQRFDLDPELLSQHIKTALVRVPPTKLVQVEHSKVTARGRSRQG